MTRKSATVARQRRTRFESFGASSLSCVCLKTLVWRPIYALQYCVLQATSLVILSKAKNMTTPTPIKQRKPTKHTLGLGLLFQRMKRNNDTLEDAVTFTRKNNDYLQQQLNKSLVEDNKYRSHFSYPKDVANQVGGIDAKKDAQTKNTDRWDLSDELFDNDAVELHSNDSVLIAELIEEREQVQYTSETKSMSGSVDGDTSSSPCTKENTRSECSTATHTLLNSPPSTDLMAFCDGTNQYNFYALHAFSSDPVPSNRICP